MLQVIDNWGRYPFFATYMLYVRTLLLSNVSCKKRVASPVPVLLILFLAAANPILAAPIYVYKEPDGVVRFTSHPPPAGVNAKVFKGRQSGFSYYKVSKRSPRRYKSLFTTEYTSFINAASAKYAVSTDVIRAVIHAESAFNPRAISPKGARGLMQLMGENIRRFGVRNPFSPKENIDAGVRLLAILHKKYRGNLALALAAYNAGEKAVQRYNGIPPYQETRTYVRKVLELKKQYRVALYG